MLFSAIGTTQGYNFQPEFIDMYCVLTLANSATCAQGQVLVRDVTKIAGTAGADMVVLPTSANGGPVYGVYQGPSFTNSSGASATYPITVRVFGIGVVSASGQAPAAVNVGDNLIVNSSQLASIKGTAAISSQVGVALATGAVTSKGAQLIASGANFLLVNAAILIQ